MIQTTSVGAICVSQQRFAIASIPSLPNLSNNSLTDLYPDALANAASPSHPVGVTVTWWTFLCSPNLGSEPGSRLARLLGWVPRLVDIVAMLSFSIPIIPHSPEWLFQTMMDIIDTRRHKKTPVDVGAINQKFSKSRS
jgi:hypothetical protein